MQIDYRCKSISLIEGDAETPLSLEYKYVPATIGAGGDQDGRGHAVGCSLVDRRCRPYRRHVRGPGRRGSAALIDSPRT